MASRMLAYLGGGGRVEGGGDGDDGDGRGRGGGGKRVRWLAEVWRPTHEAPSVLKMSRFDVTSPTGVPDVTW